MAVEFIGEQESNVSQLDGFWTSHDTYILATPYGFIVVFYTAVVSRVVMTFIDNGHRWARTYDGVQSQKHAVTLAKRFYRDLMK